MTEPVALDELLQRARANDPQAAGRLLEEHRERLRALAQRQLHGRLTARVDASDVVQQTFLEAHRALADFRGATGRELAAWLEQILDRNIAGVIRDHALLQKRAVSREQSLDESGAGPGSNDLPAGHSTPSQRAVRNEGAARVERALAQLPHDQRVAVRLRHLEGRPLADIAQRLDRTPAAAASLIKRGLQRLREALDQEP